jgi:hypothetical protein
MSAENASTDFSALMASRLFTRITEEKAKKPPSSNPPRKYGKEEFKKIFDRIQAGVGSPTTPQPKPSKREDSSTNLKNRMVGVLFDMLTEADDPPAQPRKYPTPEEKDAMIKARQEREAKRRNRGSRGHVETAYGGSKGKFRVRHNPDGTTADLD